MNDLPGLLYFQNGGIYTGSFGETTELRYKIKPEDNKLKVEMWNGPYCYEKSEVTETVEFILDQDGRFELIDFLTDKMKTRG